MMSMKSFHEETDKIKSEMDFVGRKITDGHYRLLKLRIALLNLKLNYNKYILTKPKS